MDYSIPTLTMIYLMSEYYHCGAISLKDYIKFLDLVRDSFAKETNYLNGILNRKFEEDKNAEN